MKQFNGCNYSKQEFNKYTHRYVFEISSKKIENVKVHIYSDNKGDKCDAICFVAANISADVTRYSLVGTFTKEEDLAIRELIDSI